jgi:hypothetical protein
MTDPQSMTDSYRMKKIVAYLAIIVGGIVAFAVLAPLMVPMVIAIASLAIVIGCPVWVFLDARRLGVKSPLLWALFSVFAPVLGTVIYLIARPEAPVSAPCPTCGATVLASYALCPQCGRDLPPARHFCGACNREVDQSWKFCPYCRIDLARAPRAGHCPNCSLRVEPAWRFCPMCETPLPGRSDETTANLGGLT